jgi:hypothetical protein
VNIVAGGPDKSLDGVQEFNRRKSARGFRFCGTPVCSESRRNASTIATVRRFSARVLPPGLLIIGYGQETKTDTENPNQKGKGVRYYERGEFIT